MLGCLDGLSVREFVRGLPLNLSARRGNGIIIVRIF